MVPGGDKKTRLEPAGMGRQTGSGIYVKMFSGQKRSSQRSNKNIQWLKTWWGHDVLYFQRCVMTRSGFVSRLQKKDVFLPSPKKEIAKISDAF